MVERPEAKRRRTQKDLNKMKLSKIAVPAAATFVALLTGCLTPGGPGGPPGLPRMHGLPGPPGVQRKSPIVLALSSASGDRDGSPQIFETRNPVGKVAKKEEFHD